MKILFISEVMPYSNIHHAGGKVFYNHLLSVTKYVDADILCFYDKGEDENIEDLKNICKNVVLISRGKINNKISNIAFQIKKISLAMLKPYITLGYPANIKEFRMQLENMITENNYDLIELTFTSSLAFLPFIKKIKPNIKINIVEHDVSFLNLQRVYKYEKNYIKSIVRYIRYKVYKKYEIKLLDKCDLITVLNNKDKKLLLDEDIDENKIQVVVPYFDNPHTKKTLKGQKIENSLLFYGAMWRNENDESIYYFLKNVFPSILKEKPSVKLFIVGNKPSDRVLSYHNNKNIFVTGFVDDASQFFEKCEIFIVPLLLGAGIKIKTLEALAYGLPLVSTNIGLEGINADKYEAAVLVNDIKDFSNKVLSLLNNENKRKKLSDKALEFISENYDYELSIKRLLNRYKELFSKKF